MHSKIPERTILDLHYYVEFGRPQGDFLQAVLSNDLLKAAIHADEENMAALGEIVRFVYQKVPAIAWGSPERYQTWIERGGKNAAV